MVLRVRVSAGCKASPKHRVLPAGDDVVDEDREHDHHHAIVHDLHPENRKRQATETQSDFSVILQSGVSLRCTRNTSAVPECRLRIDFKANGASHNRRQTAQSQCTWCRVAEHGPRATSESGPYTACRNTSKIKYEKRVRSTAVPAVGLVVPEREGRASGGS